METKPKKTIWVEGPISADKIAKSIAAHQTKKDIGAHSIFLGQVRADTINGQTVAGIEYSAYTEMADEAIAEIREKAFSKFDLTCMHIYHSVGMVKSGEICLFVFTSSTHRKAAIDACDWIVESIKELTPIFGKEWFENEEYTWKVNK